MTEPTTSHFDLRCPQCNYALRGLQRSDCPECGLADAVNAAIANRPRYGRWVHGFAIATVIVTFALIVLGGTVTSEGVGLAVPDWPDTYGHNMFLFPPSMWVGGIFWEHTHRLLGSVVGLMSIALMVMLIRTQKPRPWLRWLGVGALAAVIAQGVMGGLRVTEMSVTLAVLHGVSAQLVLCLFVLIAAATSRWWIEHVFAPMPPEESWGEGSREKHGLDRHEGSPTTPRPAGAGLRRMAVLTFVIVIVQLILGAVMRHNNAGLAIPDFPTHFGQALPPLTQQGIIDATVAHVAEAPDAEDGYGYFVVSNFATPFQVGVHVAHRVWAIVVVLHVVLLLRRVGQVHDSIDRIRPVALALLALTILQMALGVSVIWTGRVPEVATAHQALGAALLATLALLLIRIYVLNPRLRRETDAAAALALPRGVALKGGAA